MERTKKRTNCCFFTKTCDEGFYTFRSISHKRKESDCPPLALIWLRHGISLLITSLY
ncbi:hypothetical protein LINPERPRIM_LOCUS36914 [Linum perenne]